MPAIFKRLEENYLKLSICKKKAFDYLVNNKNKQNLLFITGGGGVGKSFLINHIYEYFSAIGVVCQKLATSGQAAKLINGITVHSFFSMNYEMNIILQYKSAKWLTIKNTEYIIIDELSLLNGELLNKINEFYKLSMIIKYFLEEYQ